MASPQKPGLPAAIARLSSYHFLLHPKYDHKARVLPFVRSVHLPVNDDDPTPPSQPKQAAFPRTRHPPGRGVQERAKTLSVPGFNLPGGGGGFGPGGSSTVIQITRSPLLDVALNTIIGLSIGERSKALNP